MIWAAIRGVTNVLFTQRGRNDLKEFWRATKENLRVGR